MGFSLLSVTITGALVTHSRPHALCMQTCRWNKVCADLSVSDRHMQR